MKQFWICVAISIVIVILLIIWISKASEDYLDKHPELAAEAKKSVEGYNAAVERHNEQVTRTQAPGRQR